MPDSTLLLTGSPPSLDSAAKCKVSAKTRNFKQRTKHITIHCKISRCIKLIVICSLTIICLCIWLLYIKTQQHPPPKPPSTITAILNAQYVKIVQDMKKFDYPNGRYGIQAAKLADMTPDTGGQPIRSIIFTTWRSGSTFLGAILNAIPGNYYHYEPMDEFGAHQIKKEQDAVLAIANIKNLLRCNYTRMSDYLEHGNAHTVVFRHNKRLWEMCKDLKHLCWCAKFLTPCCRLYPIQSMKTVRLRLVLAEQLLKDESLNVRIILLVRDPRGTMHSRWQREFCPGFSDCDTPKNLCSDLVDDFMAAENLLKRYPTRFRTVRYEDLSLNPYNMTQDILQFFGLPYDPMVEKYLDTHTKMNFGDFYSTYRDSKSTPFHWKQKLMIDEIKSIQESCTKAMEVWGYRMVENFNDSEYMQNFNPLIQPPPFVKNNNTTVCDIF